MDTQVLMFNIMWYNINFNNYGITSMATTIRIIMQNITMKSMD